MSDIQFPIITMITISTVCPDESNQWRSQCRQGGRGAVCPATPIKKETVGFTYSSWRIMRDQSLRRGPDSSVVYNHWIGLYSYEIATINC